MKVHFINVVAVLAAVFIGIGLFVGEVPWLGLAGSVIGFSIAEIIRGNKVKKGEIVDAPNDERVTTNIRRFEVTMFALSYGVLFLYAFIARYAADTNTIRTDYVLIYIVAVFFIWLIGISIVKKR
ncbi:hypothetical protein [Pontibacillus salipaludis]|uniref:DUF2178 domain-containing protein n=1 Tax=Pontibacillus salipaludis TaxID=1697394 RepID=A0ABQ1QKU7_9BACI|nr:hypothetical protein [Pontibacillus salipaludis]GGD29557.1 hypothetical protein GCM10011389_41370 [Pontibacillus salipaludis]